MTSRNEVQLMMAERTSEYCEAACDASRFFRLLAEQSLPPSLMQYTFLQYRFYRDQLHRWFGRCVVKAETCADRDQRAAVMSLAEHLFVDLRDGHDFMYREFLGDLGVTDDEVEQSTPSSATRSYSASFLNDHGPDVSGLYEALAALSGREMCVAVRNGRLIQHYFAPRGLRAPTWIELHATLEVEHFHAGLQPAVSCLHADPAALATLLSAVERSIRRHTQYFDDLLEEWEAIE
jgi:thiaminase